MKLLLRAVYLTSIILSFIISAEIVAADQSGKWQGTLTIPTGDLEIIIVIDQQTMTGTMDVPAQNLKGMPLDELTISDKSFSFQVKKLGIIYSGNMSQGKINGTFQQGPSFKTELNFARQSTAQQQAIDEKMARPQTPKGPFPYLEEEVTFANADITLSGTITKPDGDGPFPAAIMITGSGPQDRDETILGHKPFAVIADHLTRRGILVLRFDDRGVAQSTGQFKGSTIEDFATDVEAAFQFLLTRDDVVSDKIGLIGHSEGGVVGPLMAKSNEKVAFLVSLAGIGTSPKELYATQQRDMLLLNGATNGQLIYDSFMQAIDKVVNGANAETIEAHMKQTLRYPDQAAKLLGNFMTDPWFISLMNYDNAATLSQLTLPVLAINGEKDIQVEPKANLAGFEKYLNEAGNKDVTITEISGLNHLFQPSETGNPAEYANIKVTFDEATLKLVGDWIVERVK